jgi:gamma-glutamyltranspeptidase / glutathione hydrolase
MKVCLPPRSALLVLLAAVVVPPVPSADAAYPPSAEGVGHGVVTDHADATRAAMQVLKDGGSAADAAVVAALVVGVVSPSGSGIGGGGFAVVYAAKTRQATTFDFREAAPAGVDADKLLAAKGPRHGEKIGIPGEPLGLETIHKRYGKKPWRDLVNIAASIAESGFYVSHHLHGTTAYAGNRFTAEGELREVLYHDGKATAFGAKVTRPQLGRTLRAIAEGGSRAFYTGAIATAILTSAKAYGSPMTAADLEAYKVIERKPLARGYGGKYVYTMGAPSAGGLMLHEVLGTFGIGEASNLKAPFGSSEYFHFMAESMRGAVADRVRVATDPSMDTNVESAYDKLLDPAQLAARRKSIDGNKTHAAPDFRTPEHGTSHISVVDGDGNAVALTTTVNNAFGSGIEAEGAGFLLNDQLDDFSAPGDVKAFGVSGPGPNRPRAGARPVSSMAPTIVVGGAGVEMVAGGSGGTRIATGIAQATVCRLVYGLDPMTCVSAPRVHISGAPGISVEREVSADTIKGLEARGEVTTSEAPFPTGIQMIAIDRSSSTPHVMAAGDPRKSAFASAR